MTPSPYFRRISIAAYSRYKAAVALAEGRPVTGLHDPGEARPSTVAYVSSISLIGHYKDILSGYDLERETVYRLI